MSARTRASIISALLLTALSVVMVTAWLVIQGRQLRAGAEVRAIFSIQLMVEAFREPLEEGDILRLAQIADRAVRSKQVNRIIITDRNARVIVDTSRRAYNERYPIAARVISEERIHLERHVEEWTAADGVRDALGRAVGAVVVTFATTSLHAAQRAARRAGVLIALAGIAIGMLLSFLAMDYLVRPLTDLVRAIRRVEAGELESLATVTGTPELAQISEAFNSMVGAVRLRIRNLELLNEMETNLALSRDLESAVEIIGRTCKEMLGASTYLWVREPLMQRLVEVVPPGETPISEPVMTDSDFPVPRSYANRRMIVIGEGRDLPQRTEIVSGLPVHSSVLLALWTPEGTVGVLALTNLHGRQFVSREDIALARAIAALVAPMVSSAVRTQMQARAVTALQTLLIPAIPSNIGADVYALYLPAEEAAGVGGDYYDFDDLGDSRWGIVMADASGKGLDAARYATMTKWILRSFIHEYRDPAEVLRQCNRVLAVQEMAEGFITLFCCIWDADKMSIVYASAGHLPGLLYRASSDQVEELSSIGTALGITPDTTYTSHGTELNTGDLLCLYTDGITEARHGSDWFGTDRLAAMLKDHAHEPSAEIAEAIIATIREFTGGVTRDDIALVLLKK